MCLPGCGTLSGWQHPGRNPRVMTLKHLVKVHPTNSFYFDRMQFSLELRSLTTCMCVWRRWWGGGGTRNHSWRGEIPFSCPFSDTNEEWLSQDAVAEGHGEKQEGLVGCKEKTTLIPEGLRCKTALLCDSATVKPHQKQTNKNHISIGHYRSNLVFHCPV